MRSSSGLRGFPIYYMKKTLNIDINLIKRYARSKQRKELFAMAIWCHMLRENGVVWGLDRFYIRKKLHIGKTKAERLMSDAMKDELFTFHDSYASVGSFRDMTIKRNWKGREYRSAFVYKFVFDTEIEYTLKDLYELINEILTLYPIVAKEGADCFKKRGGLDNHCAPKSHDAKARTLALRKISQNNKMSLSSSSRIINNLVGKHFITKELCRQYAVIGEEHVEAIKDCLNRLNRTSSTFIFNGLTYILVPCSYSVSNRTVSDSFFHKIYGYHKDNRKKFSCKNDPYPTIPQFHE